MNWQDIATAAAGLVAGTLIIALWGGVTGRIRVGAGLPYRVGRLEQLSTVLTKVNLSQLDALKALLEAQKGQNNGNIEDAHKIVIAAKDEAMQFLVNQAASAKGGQRVG